MTRTLRFAVDHYLLLPLGACVALAWANTRAASYFAVAKDLSFAVNDVGMALFFALIAIEVVEAGPPRLVFNDWRWLTLAVVAALGGIVGAGLVYVWYLWLGDESSLLASGWPIVCASDVAFVYFIATRLCARPVIGFVLLVAVVSDVIGLIVIEILHPIADLGGVGGPLLAAAVGLAIVMRRCGVRSYWPYLLGCGALSWCGLFMIGMHPALALLPIVPFLYRAPRNRGFMVDAPARAIDTLGRFRRAWKVPVQIVLFMFGLTNAGVIVQSVGTGTWAVALAALAGKPAGTLLALGAATAAGLRLPRSVSWRDMIVVSVASAVGFTFALFFATVTFAVGPVLNELKLGALMTSGVALLAIGVARVLRVGRFGQPVATAHASTERQPFPSEYVRM